MFEPGDNVRVLAPYRDSTYIGHFQRLGIGTVKRVGPDWVEVRWPPSALGVTEGIFRPDELRDARLPFGAAAVAT